MLLVGTQALAWCYPDAAPLDADAAWDLWVAESELRALDLDGANHETELTTDDTGDPCAAVRRGNRTYRVRVVPEGDVREQFIAANLERPLLENVAGGKESWTIHVASPASIALIERACLYAPAGWHRRVQQYHWLTSRLDQPIGSESERAAYTALRAELLARLDRESDSDFNMRVKNEEFFKDFKYPWLRVHEHDDLHRTTCYSGTPLYQKLKHDLGQAYVPQSGFDALSHDDQIRMVREECYALALERVLIPAADLGIPWSENHGFQHALRRICTTLARGWFRDYAIDHYPEVSRYDRPFLQVYQQAVEQGKLERKSLPITFEDRRIWLAEYMEAQSRKDGDALLGSVPASQMCGFAYDGSADRMPLPAESLTAAAVQHYKI